jgi:hypothetical protein
MEWILFADYQLRNCRQAVWAIDYCKSLSDITALLAYAVFPGRSPPGLPSC